MCSTSHKSTATTQKTSGKWNKSTSSYCSGIRTWSSRIWTWLKKGTLCASTRLIWIRRRRRSRIWLLARRLMLRRLISCMRRVSRRSRRLRRWNLRVLLSSLKRAPSKKNLIASTCSTTRYKRILKSTGLPSIWCLMRSQKSISKTSSTRISFLTTRRSLKQFNQRYSIYKKVPK